jgi:outer membrane receptor protein involved in Fe transport
VEAGTRQRLLEGAAQVEVVAYWQRKRQFILRDAAGFNVSDGRTRGSGVELGFSLAPAGYELAFDLNLAYARLRYDFDRAIAGGELISKGNEEDTAPRWLGSAHWRWTPTPALRAELEVIHQGRYEIDAANTADYPGHTLVNLRADWRVTTELSLFARVMNVLDREYADRADIAFGNERYFPGEPRRAFVGLTWTPAQ